MLTDSVGIASAAKKGVAIDPFDASGKIKAIFGHGDFPRRPRVLSPSVGGPLRKRGLETVSVDLPGTV